MSAQCHTARTPCPRSVTLRGHHVHGHHVRGHHVRGHHVRGHHVHGHHVRGHHVHEHHGHRLTAGLQSQSIFYPFGARAVIFPRLQLWSRLRLRFEVFTGTNTRKICDTLKENKICIPARIQHPPFPKAPNLIHVQKVE